SQPDSPSGVCYRHRGTAAGDPVPSSVSRLVDSGRHATACCFGGQGYCMYIHYDEPNPSGASRRPKRQEEPRMPRSLDHAAFEAIHVTCKRLASRISVGSKERSMSHSRSKGTALITGASAGIGAVYADRLAKRNYDLVLVARNEARLKALSGRLTSETGRSVTPLRADL